MPHEGPPSQPKPTLEELQKTQQAGLYKIRQEKAKEASEKLDATLGGRDETLSEEEQFAKQYDAGSKLYDAQQELTNGPQPMGLEEAQEEAQIVHMLAQELGHEPTGRDYDGLSQEFSRLKVLAAENEEEFSHQAFNLLRKLHVFPQGSSADEQPSIDVLTGGVAGYSDRLEVLKKRAQEAEQKNGQKAA